MKTLILLWAIKLVFGKSHECHIPDMCLPKGLDINNRSYKGKLTDINSKIDRFDSSKFWSESFSIPREIVFGYFQSFCGFSVELSKTHHPDRLAKIIVRTSTGFDFNSNANCGFKISFDNETNLISNCSIYDDHYFLVAVSYQVNQQNDYKIYFKYYLEWLNKLNNMKIFITSLMPQINNCNPQITPPPAVIRPQVHRHRTRITDNRAP